MNWSGVGHEKQKEYFERLITGERLAHAYLLVGPDMVGKRGIAEDILQYLIPWGHQLDMMRLAPERDEETGKLHDIAIDQTKALKSWVTLRPTGTHKVIVIDDADRLGGEAANNLLKILEEPPAYAHFFLVTAKPGQVMATIASRGERIDFHTLSEEEMVQVLVHAKLDADDKALIAAVAAGRPGLAMRLIQDKQLPMVAKAIADFGTVLKGGVAEKIVYAKKLADHDRALDIVSWWLAWTHSQLATKPHLASVAAGLLELSDVLAEPQFNRRLAIEHFFLTISGQKG